MVKPIILAVDDEPQVLNAISRDLRQYYGSRYSIMTAGSGAEALRLVQQLKQRGAPLALLLVDQRMPGMEGTAFLTEAIRFYPQVCKVLLTAYADTEAAIASINKIGLDYYLMKPWDPPEQYLYPVLDELLNDWIATVGLPFEGIRVAGTQWSASSYEVKDFLARNRIPYKWLDIERDHEALALVESVANEDHQLPVIFFPDGRVLINPDPLTLADQCGLQTKAAANFYDLVVIGAGPAGLGAAVYGASEGLRTLLVDKAGTGGQAGTSSRIENYLGFPTGISGGLLAERATLQARRLGAEILMPLKVIDIRIEDPYRYIRLSNSEEIGCKAIVIATGVTTRTLDVPGAKRLNGAGVYYGAAVTEAENYKGEHVFVIGGANSAGQGAMHFSRFARQVTMLVRGEGLERTMSQYLINQINGTANIEVRNHTTVTAVEGDQHLETVTITNLETGREETLPASALYIFIGAEPHTDVVRKVVACDPNGFILTGPDLMRDGRPPAGWPLRRDPYLLETSVPGIFAAGDVRWGAVRRVASAVGQGANVISFVHQYLQTV